MDAAVAAVTAEFAAHRLHEQQQHSSSPASASGGTGRAPRRQPRNQASAQQLLRPVAGDAAASSDDNARGVQKARRGAGQTGRGRGAGAAGAGGRNHRINGVGGRPSTSASASASENESHNTRNVVDLPAPATQVSQPRKHPQKQQRFRSQLSEPSTNAIDTSLSATASTFTPASVSASALLAPKTPLPSQDELAALSYRERLTVQLNTASIECPICYNPIGRRQPLSSCSTCSAPYHLKCIRDWAERSIVAVKEKAALQQPGVHVRASWRCPSCQSQYAESEIPKIYKCFCGRVKDPKTSALGNAHSCEKPCRRPRPEGCQHSCPLQCHPANCDPCSVMLRLPCYCGKEQKAILCGALHPASTTTSTQRVDPSQFLSCKQACDRLLGCGLHRCERECHDGECGACELVRDKTCFCGSQTRALPCGGAEQALERTTCRSPEKEGRQEVEEWQGEFSCGQPCPWVYDCGIHTEADTSGVTCHPHLSSRPLVCPRSPAVVSTCACGQTPLDTLSTPLRKACTDPVPSCGKVCSKIRPECGHACTRICHEGGCGTCTETVRLVCRCGNEKRTMACVELQKKGEAELLCEKPCKALRNCGRHECTRKCCPLAFQEANQKQRRRPLAAADEEDPLGYHVCDRVCNRTLNCGEHRCQLPDHRGPCQPCLRSSFDELTCHCGSTTLIPPVPCSTRIVCNQPCARPGPTCGHPKAPHTCHEDDQPCPPCPFLTMKHCQCHRHAEVRNVRCSQANVSCGKTCDALLACGYHRCKKMCHPAGECQECVQTCGKPRAFCGHPCPQKCHAPTKCPTGEPCTELVEATCPCGHIKQRTRCGACNSKTEPNGGIKLVCNQTCAVAQRNAALADALGISKDRQAGAAQDVTWLPETLQYYGENINWAKGIEQVLLDFIGSTRATHMFPAMKHPQRKFVHELAEKCKLRSESLDEEPFRSVLVARKTESAPPKPSVSEAWIQQYRLSHPSSTAKKQNLATQPTPAPILTPAPLVHLPKQELNALYLEACFGYDEQGLKDVLAPFMQGMQFTVKWITDEDVLCLPRTTLPPHELTLKLRLARNAVRHKLESCASVDAAYYDAKVDGVTHRERQWTSVSTSSGAATNRWAAGSASLTSTNNFSALASTSAGKKTPKHSRPASPAVSDSHVITNGLHRPPSAIILPDIQHNVVDSWEDSV